MTDKPIIFVFAASAVLLMAGCEDARFKDDSRRSDDIATYQDADTGCVYISRRWGNGIGLTPRIAADGKTHMGCKEGGKQ